MFTILPDSLQTSVHLHRNKGALFDAGRYPLLSLQWLEVQIEGGSNNTVFKPTSDSNSGPLLHTRNYGFAKGHQKSAYFANGLALKTWESSGNQKCRYPPEEVCSDVLQTTP